MEADGYSFAYLKELCLASMMRWLVRAEQGAMLGVMLAQTTVLREQMVSLPMPGGEPSPDLSAIGAQLGRIMTRMRRYGPGPGTP